MAAGIPGYRAGGITRCWCVYGYLFLSGDKGTACPFNALSLQCPHIVSPSDDERQAAFTQIDNPEHRLLRELFWFWPDSDPDDAFDAVQAKDQDRLVKEWRRRSTISDPEGVASHNLAVFNHLMALQTEDSKLLGQPVIASDASTKLAAPISDCGENHGR
jgi:hypothetical protein